MKKRVLIGLSVLWFCILFPAGGCATEAEKSLIGATEQGILAEFEITKGEDILLLPVKFRSEEHLFIFDTGCSWVAFDTSFKNILGNVKRSETVNRHDKPITSEVFNAPEVFLGPINMEECGEVVCVDLKKASLALGKKVDGLIGMNFLRKYIVQIDFDEGKLLFFQRNKGKKTDWGEKLPVRYNSGGIPQIRGNIQNGGETYFMIDTGANITKCLESNVFENVAKRKGVATWGELDRTTSGSARSKEIRIDRLSFGSLKYEGLIFNEGRVSFLGTEFLSRHIVTFDFPHNAIYLKRGEDFGRIDEVDMSGLHLVRISNETMVQLVDEGSPAEKAGIKANDVILKIDGKDAQTYSRWEISRLKKSWDKRKITMMIKRGDDIKQVSFLLEKKI